METTTAVREKPILFKGEMVRAILEGRKTQTRRLIKQSDLDKMEGLCMEGEEPAWCPFGKIGDILWVRETWAYVPQSWPDEDEAHYQYKADGKELWRAKKWKPSIFMPRDACRIRLEITNVRSERLQDISQEDAMNEGVYPMPHRCEGWVNPLYNFRDCFKCSYRFLWNKINGPLGHQWDKNEWVWVIEFKRI